MLSDLHAARAERPRRPGWSVAIVLASSLLGFAVGRWSATVEPGVDEQASRPAGADMPTAPDRSLRPSDDESRVRDLERELALERIRAANLEVVAYGQAPAWPAEVLPGHSPEAFQAFVQQAVTGVA